MPQPINPIAAADTPMPQQKVQSCPVPPPTPDHSKSLTLLTTNYSYPSDQTNKANSPTSMDPLYAPIFNQVAVLFETEIQQGMSSGFQSLSAVGDVTVKNS